MAVTTTLGSFLMLAIDPYLYPPYRRAAMHAGYRLDGAEVARRTTRFAMYQGGACVLGRVRERAQERGLQLRDRLDAQSVVWSSRLGCARGWPEEDRLAFDSIGRRDRQTGGGRRGAAEPAAQPGAPAADPLVPPCRRATWIDAADSPRWGSSRGKAR